MPHFRAQRGLVGAAFVVILVVAIMALVLGGIANRSLEVGLDQRGVTDARMKRIAEALVNHAALNQRLPCPARGDLDTGDAEPNVATTTCTASDGVVPWRSLAIRREDAVDGWGRKISYRVFDGAKGFTRSGSVNLTKCNTALGAPINPALDADFMCQTGSPPPNTPAQFFQDRGDMLVVSDMATLRKGNAFVLISHGDSGLGAFPDGLAGRNASPTNSGELANTQSAGPYWILPRSAPTVAPDSPTHFDDIVSYMGTADLASRAKLGARAWSDPLSAQFNQPNLVAAGATFPTAENTGMQSLGIGGFLVSASAGGTSQNIGYRVDGSIGGIGAIGGGSSRGDLNSAFNEKLTFQLGAESPYGKMDVALNAFQIASYFPLQKERATISFWLAGEPIQTTTVDSWADAPPPSQATRCLFRLGASRVFDRMDVAPETQSGFGGSSRFTVAEIKACTDATTPCVTAVPGAIDCPIPSASAASIPVSSVGSSQAQLNGVVEDNGVARGSGSGYLTNSVGYPAVSRVITLTSGSGTILAGNCVTFAGDANVYVVAAGINAPGNLTLAAPGLRQSIPAAPTAVTLTNCQNSVSFDWGGTCGYGSNIAASPATINAGSGISAVSATLPALTCNTSYYFRTRVTGPGGTTLSNDKMFRTAIDMSCPNKVIAVAAAATAITETSARLNGTVEDKGLNISSVQFEYGTTSCYGSTYTSTPAAIVSGSGITTVSALLDSSGTPPVVLNCGTRYHYRVKATSFAGTTASDDMTFVTAPCP